MGLKRFTKPDPLREMVAGLETMRDHVEELRIEIDAELKCIDRVLGIPGVMSQLNDDDCNELTHCRATLESIMRTIEHGKWMM